jgi:hypothetical protein
MIDDNYDNDFDSLDCEALEAYQEEGFINTADLVLGVRSSGNNLATRPQCRSITRWDVELFHVRTETKRIAIRLEDVPHAIRLLRRARWQVRWWTAERFLRDPGACVRGRFERAREDWAFRWLFFKLQLKDERRDGLSWPKSIRRSLPLLLK